jgi:hypothetical protein
MSIARSLMDRLARRTPQDALRNSSRDATPLPRTAGKRYAQCLTLAVATASALAACAMPEKKLPAGTPVAQVYSTLGQPRERYPLDDGITRLLWPTRPFGETTVAVDVDASGKVLQTIQVLDNRYLYQAIPDKWTQKDVLSHFGEPVCKQYFSLSHRAAWSYRYMDAGVWYSMFVFLFDDQGVLRGTQKAPDPMHDPDHHMGLDGLC